VCVLSIISIRVAKLGYRVDLWKGLRVFEFAYPNQIRDSKFLAPKILAQKPDIGPAMHYVKQLFQLFAFLLLATGSSLHAQNQFAPPGAEWCLSGYDGSGETLGYIKVRYERDSIVAGLPTKVMSIKSRKLTPRGLVDVFTARTELFQQSGDSVFYYVPAIADQVYLFKENYVAAEETTSWMYNDIFSVLTVDESLVDGYPVSVAKMNLLPWLMRDLPVTMYGAWGPDRGFITNWGPFLDGEGGEWLEAFRADSVPEVKVVPRSPCFSLMEVEDNRITVQTPIENSNILAFPNPVTSADEWVRIRFDSGRYISGNYTLLIYNAEGRVVGSPRLMRSIPNDFSVQDLPSGRYFGLIVGEGERFEFSFIRGR